MRQLCWNAYRISADLVTGPDHIPNIFIKKCASSLLKPITALLKSSFTRGSVPDIWKRSFVQPIFKCGNKSDVSNYRSVAIQWAIQSHNSFWDCTITEINELFLFPAIENIILSNVRFSKCTRCNRRPHLHFTFSATALMND